MLRAIIKKNLILIRDKNLLWMKRDASYFLKQPATQTHNLSDIPQYEPEVPHPGGSTSERVCTLHKDWCANTEITDPLFWAARNRSSCQISTHSARFAMNNTKCRLKYALQIYTTIYLRKRSHWGWQIMKYTEQEKTSISTDTSGDIRHWLVGG